MVSIPVCYLSSLVFEPGISKTPNPEVQAKHNYLTFKSSFRKDSKDLETLSLKYFEFRA